MRNARAGEVLCYDATEDDTHAALDDAAERLAAAAARAGGGVPVRLEVLAGPAGETLRRSPRSRRWICWSSGGAAGSVSARLLGSVSTDVVQHSSVPVLVVEPAPAERSSSVDEVVSVSASGGVILVGFGRLGTVCAQ
ncbi:MAG: universal stress protein [Actinomycetota bacterium]|nr:universal stress protein [Actinomycetota bacterium]